MEVRGGRMTMMRSGSREMSSSGSSPDRAKTCVQAAQPAITRDKVMIKPINVVPCTFKKVQIVYYLSRNGHLEHPHYMEVTHLAHQHLRLKDVVNRLTVLRGKGMPSLYSWSCKRSYKNGYVWNDLAENDIIFPSEGGAEYVLKGSEIVQDDCQQIQVSNTQELGFHTKRKPLASKRRQNHHHHHHYPEPEDEEEQEEQEVENNQYENEDEEKEGADEEKSPSYEIKPHILKNSSTIAKQDETLPSSATSSAVSGKVNSTSKRFEDGDPVVLGRSSVLFQLIGCGGAVPFRGKSTASAPAATKNPSSATRMGRKSESLHKGVLCKNAGAKAVVAEEEDDEMISCMSENPRFGNLQSEEKEYFSGSIVEAMNEERQRAEAAEPRLKKSSSYNEERSCKERLGEEEEEEEEEEKVVVELRRTNVGVKGKCIPRKKKSTERPRPRPSSKE